MKIIEGKLTNELSCNIKIAEHQDEYETLHAHKTADGRLIYGFELSDEEASRILMTNKIYLMQWVGDSPMQPILPIADLESALLDPNLQQTVHIHFGEMNGKTQLERISKLHARFEEIAVIEDTVFVKCSPQISALMERVEGSGLEFTRDVMAQDAYAQIGNTRIVLTLFKDPFTDNLMDGFTAAHPNRMSAIMGEQIEEASNIYAREFNEWKAQQLGDSQ